MIVFSIDHEYFWPFISDWGIQQWGGGVWLADHGLPPETDHTEHTETLPQSVRAHGGVQQQIQVRHLQHRTHWTFISLIIQWLIIKNLSCEQVVISFTFSVHDFQSYLLNKGYLLLDNRYSCIYQCMIIMSLP